MGINSSKSNQHNDGNGGERKSNFNGGGGSSNSDTDMPDSSDNKNNSSSSMSNSSGSSGSGSGSRNNSSSNYNNISNSNNNNNSNSQQLQVINNVIDYKSLLKKKNNELLNVLVEKGPPIFLEFLLFLKTQLAHNHISMRQFIEKVNIVFYLSVDSKDIKQYLSSISKPRSCHKVWGPNGLFYRCKTCALSPSSSICYDCFAAGPHEKEGHDYSTSFAYYGGSCDCGTMDSWKESGFCSNHAHTGPEEDPTLNMKSDLLISTHLSIRCILSIILELNSHTVFQTEFSHGAELYSKIVYLFLFLLCDHTFKVGFSKSYTHVYSQLAKISTIDAVYRYSPQVFSISSISTQFSKEYNPSFLDTTLDALLMVLSRGGSLDRHHTAIISDIKTLIQAPTLCHYILFEKRSLLNKYLYVLRRAHCFERFTRQMNTHVEYDRDEWIYSFQLDSEFRDISKEMIESIPADIKLKDMLDLIDYYTNFLVDATTEFSGSYLGVSVSNTDLFDGTSSVSLILPLYRFYVQLIQKTRSLFGDSTDLKSLFPKRVNLSRILMPFVLCQVFVHQVNNSYWVRNNHDMVRKKAFLYCLFFLENDISIIQTIASVLDVNEFLIFASKEFGAFLPVVVKNQNDHNNHKYFHFFKFIIQIYQERASMVPNREYVKNALVHLLYGQAKTHSKIESTMTYLDKEQLFESILQEVATMEQQTHTGDQPAIFKLKPEFWKQFNPYYPLYTPQNVEDSIVAYFDFKKNRKLKNPDSLPLPPPLAPLIEWNQPVEEIVHSDFAHYMALSLLHSFTKRIFESGNTTPDDIPEVMFAVNECLYYLALSTNVMKPWYGNDNNDNNNNNDKGDCSSHLPMDKLNHPELTFVSHKHSVLCMLQKYLFKDTVTSTFDILIEMLKRTHQNNLFVDKRDLITKIIDSLFGYHPDIQEYLFEKYPNYKQTLEEQVKSSDEKLKGAKQRQAEIMAKFTQQQNKFLMTLDSDDELESNDCQVATCVLCLKGNYSKKDPLSVIAMYQYSTLITFSKIAVLANLPLRLKKHCKDFLKYISFPQQRSQLDLLNYTSSLHMRCCGHHIHHDCFKHYTDALMHKASQLDGFEGDHIIRPLSGEFLCPMCRRVSNIIIPIVDNNSNNNNNNQQQQTTNNTSSTTTTTTNKERTSPFSHLSMSNGSSSSNASNGSSNLVNSGGKDQIEILSNSGKDQQQATVSSDSDLENNNINTDSNNNNSLSTSFGKEKMDSFDDVTKNQLSNWFSSLVPKGKSSAASPAKKSEENLFFFHELNRVAFKGGNVDTISPYFLCQLTARNIEFLEIATREIQQPSNNNNNYNNNNNNNNSQQQQQTPQFCIGADIFARDILTIKSLYKVFRDYIHQHKEHKYRESTIDLFKGMSESILSIDPFGSFILFLSVLDSPSNFDIDVITSFSLDLVGGNRHQTEKEPIATNMDSTCCVINSSTEANKHMNVCGIYKIGVFLETKSPTVAIIRDYRESLMHDAYLDQYGEPDSHLDRVAQSMSKNSIHSVYPLKSMESIDPSSVIPLSKVKCKYSKKFNVRVYRNQIKIIYNNSFPDQFEDLVEGKTCYITDVLAEISYFAVDHPFTLKSTFDTKVIPCPNEFSSLHTHYKFISMSSLESDYKELIACSRNYVDVIGYVKSKESPLVVPRISDSDYMEGTTLSIQTITLADSKNYSISVTFFDESIRRYLPDINVGDIIAIKSAKISCFNRLSLIYSSGTYHEKDTVNFKEYRELKDWLSDNNVNHQNNTLFKSLTRQCYRDKMVSTNIASISSKIFKEEHDYTKDNLYLVKGHITKEARSLDSDRFGCPNCYQIFNDRLCNVCNLPPCRLLDITFTLTDANDDGDIKNKIDLEVRARDEIAERLVKMKSNHFSTESTLPPTFKIEKDFLFSMGLKLLESENVSIDQI
ncbi:hypothetical protein PPL_05666 [Heterostelium album PN500]|uniref:E3 ubiquitin-protein ligase n=1 Tax=Heterostelium pallidum (strain ATCC 26659 / Pp 5 / PN500) TaxID=670386 RepID=D3BAT5_HETP5|nr:hypothetical protein PPL_05666 [Heterostelium album PN500]EFA81672.1 hypothetical protein PPL_05666 [Heterostelium album PN500]|eukprot:XP_020433789.1 hypothetical protein PPL_05666 [Heterostelium album PN500]